MTVRIRTIVMAVMLCALMAGCTYIYQDAVTRQHLWRCAHTPAVETHCPSRP